jgi:hypothetical protein
MTFAVGQRVSWRHVVGSYGYILRHVGVVRKVGTKITIEVPLAKGGTKIARVSPKSLELLPDAPAGGGTE